MPATREELDRFHQFALDQLGSDEEQRELDDLLLYWYDSQESGEIDAAIRQGLSDIDAGLGRPARDVMRELDARYGLSAE